jgi:hypothetical protein
VRGRTDQNADAQRDGERKQRPISGFVGKPVHRLGAKLGRIFAKRG